jgi:hypothetical protein
LIHNKLLKVTQDVAFYTTTSRFVSWMGVFSQTRQELWLPKDDLRDSSSWSSPPLMLLMFLRSRRMLLCPFRSSTASLRLLLRGTRALPPLLVLTPSLQFKVTKQILLHSSDDPALNGHLRYPNNLDQSLNDAC